METEMKTSYRSGYNKGIGFGLVLMLIGVLFLGSNFGLIPVSLKRVIFSWQMLLIFLGVVNLLKRKLIPGLVLVFVGSFFILPKIFLGLDANFIHVYWPLLLIAAGIIILLQRVVGPEWGFGGCNREQGYQYSRHNHHHPHDKWGPSADGFSKNSVFGSGEHIVLDPEFEGGELNAVFGGLSLDLRRTNLAVGETRLDVNAVFGGITIFVPSDWLVETHLDTVFGGFQDNRMVKEPLDPTRKLVITGSCVFGGGEIRN